jgi:hypothetical protein
MHGRNGEAAASKLWLMKLRRDEVAEKDGVFISPPDY